MVKGLPANAGDMGLIPGRGRFHTPQGSKAPCATTPDPTWQLLKPMHLRAELHNKKKKHRKETCPLRLEWLPLLQLESPRAATEIQSSQK